jgi:hypothetical protein
VPGMGNPQAWDRYAYSMNNALRYIDPSGHDPKDKEPPDDSGNDWNFFEWMKEQREKKLEKLGIKELILIGEDGSTTPILISFSVGGGVFPWFVATGKDIVIVGDQIAVFDSSSIGPGLGGQDQAHTHPYIEDYTFMSPQLGGSVTWGELSGEKLLELGPSVFRGTSKIDGGSIANIAFEKIESVGIDGFPDAEIVGDLVGFGYGLPSAEAHSYYSYSEYNDTWSLIATLLYQITLSMSKQGK